MPLQSLAGTEDAKAASAESMSERLKAHVLAEVKIPCSPTNRLQIQPQKDSYEVLP